MASGDAPYVAAIVGSALVGLAIGSFLNVVAYRLPRGMSVARPPSHCPACETTLTALDTVPVVSWVALRGRCRHCGAPVSSRYPLVEAATGAAFAAVAAALGSLAPLPSVALIAACGLAAAVIDVDGLTVPPSLAVIAGIGALSLAIVAAATDHSGRDAWGLLGGALAAAAGIVAARWSAPGRWGVLAALGASAGWLWAPGGALVAGWILLVAGVARLAASAPWSSAGRQTAVRLWLTAGGAFAGVVAAAVVARP